MLFDLQIETVGLQLFQHVDIPLEIEFPDAVVGDGERPRTRIGGEIEIIALDRDQVLTIGLHDAKRDLKGFRLFDGFVARNHTAVPIEEDGATRPVSAERLGERRPPAIRAPIRIPRIEDHIGDGREGFRASNTHSDRLDDKKQQC